MPSRPSACDRKLLQESLDGQLSHDQQAELADHLEGCPQCRQHLEQMAAASNYWSDAVLLRGERTAGSSQPTGVVPEMASEFDYDNETGDAGAVWLEFLDPPDPAHPETIGRLGPYQILEVLGRGGMGVVLKARDPVLERTVAIKVLTPALSHGASARRRFAREARAIAAVGHEHIVAIHAIDEFRGLPYLVMQYVQGRSLQERLDAGGPLEVRDILRIGIQSARALAAAHTQGVVHRDIKPANILLENCVERVRLTDFGLARAIDDATLTQSGTIAGTPQYMAPEQARGEAVDARADLFALGASMYAMASGRSPFRANSAMAVLKRVCDVRHRPIRELNPDVPEWLEATIDRLLAKEPADRIQTASEVADLLEKGLAHLQQPTILPPPLVAALATSGQHDLDLGLDLGTLEFKASPRARRRLPLAAALILLSVAGLGVAEAAGLTQVSDFVATILRIKTPDGTLVVKVDDPRAEVRIDGDTVVIGGAGPQEVRLRAGNHRVQAIKDGKAVRDQLVTITKGGKEIVNVEFEPEIQKNDSVPMPLMGTRQRPKPTIGPLVGSFGDQPAQKIGPGHPARARAIVWTLAFTPDGRRLAIGEQGTDQPESIMRIWDVGQRRDVIWFQHPSGFRSVAFSSNGRTLAAGNFDGTLTTFATSDDWKIQESRIEHTENQGSAINALAFVGKSAVVAVGDWDGWIRFHGPDSLANRQPLKYPARIWTLAVSPDGSTLAVGGDAKTIQVYDLATRRLKATLNGHDHAVWSLDFSADGKWLASAGGTIARLWDTATWTDAGGAIQHFPELLSVRFSPDGKLLAVADGVSDLPHYNVLPTQIILWDVAARAEVRRLRGHTNSIWGLAYTPDGKTLASGSADQTVRLWDVATGQLRETIVPGESGAGQGR